MDASQLRNLDQLTSLHMRVSRLIDSADSLGQLVALRRFELWNSLAGIPSSLAALTGLTRLWLRGVAFSVDSQDRILPQLVGLRELMLESCGLAAVPTAVTALTALSNLDLGSNRLAQPEVLTLLTTLTHLRVLSLHRNPCDILEGLSALSGLTMLGLSCTRPSHARLERVLPRLLSLQTLVLSSCKLATVPKAITALTALTSLYLYGNLWDDVEDLAPLAALTQLRHLQLGHSKCDVPWLLSALTALTALFLDRRESHPLRTLPPMLAALTRLEVLSLRRAKVKTGWQHLRPLSRLRELHLDGCVFQTLPRQLTALQALEELRLGRSRPVRGWQHLLALPRLRWLTTSVEPPPAVVDHVAVIDFYDWDDWDELDSDSELSDD